MATVNKHPTVQITTVQVTVGSPPPSRPSSPPRHQPTLHTPSGMPERPSSSGTKAETSYGRPIRQPIREDFHTASGHLHRPTLHHGSTPTSPEHDNALLLSSGANSHRFSSHHIGSSMHFSGEIHSQHSSMRIESSVHLGGSNRVDNWVAHGHPQGRPTFDAPPPGRSWTAIGMSLVAGLKQAAAVAGEQLALTVSTVTLPLAGIKPKLMGALAGHGLHQIVAVGIPTFVREMVAVGVMHAMRHSPPHAVVGLQVGVGVANLAIQLGREYRESRNINAAARSYFSLSKEEWAAKSPVQRNEMRTHMRQMSRLVTNMQVMASITNGLLMWDSFNRNDHLGTLRPVATEIKVGVYAAMRDGLQATFTMVKLTPPTLPDGSAGSLAPGMSGAAHGAAAATYAGANFAAAFLNDALMGALVPGRNDAVATLVGEATHAATVQAVATVAMASSVAAATNTLAEVTDWFSRMQHFVGQTPGATQSWGPALTGNDYGRLLDQAPARAAAFNAIFSTLGVLGLGMSKTELPGAVQQFLGNATVGVMIGMLDSPVMGIWQAEEAVRAEPTPTPTPAPSTVTITEIEPNVDLETGTGPNDGVVNEGSNGGNNEVDNDGTYEVVNDPNTGVNNEIPSSGEVTSSSETIASHVSAEVPVRTSRPTSP